MRIKITLRPRSSKIIIPFNHNDYIIGFISQILKSIQNELRYRNDFRLLPFLRKSFRFFTFSRIIRKTPVIRLILLIHHKNMSTNKTVIT